MISAAHAKRIADLTGEQARERAELAIRHANERETLFDGQRAQRAVLSQQIGIPVDEGNGAKPADAGGRPAGTTEGAPREKALPLMPPLSATWTP
jgi:hypothetical protein